MSIFGSIWSKISGHATTSTASGQAATSPVTISDPESTAAPQMAAPAQNSVGGSGPSPASTAAPSPASASSAAAAPVDVSAVLTELASKKREKLDWHHSIVDLLKVLDLDSSLTARKSLAEELHYTGDTNDSATMNMWLQKQVMAKLTANGGKVPADLQT